MANAYSRFDIFSESLFHFLYNVTVNTQFSSSDFQNIAVLMTAFVKVRTCILPLLPHPPFPPFPPFPPSLIPLGLSSLALYLLS
eukprot:225279-Hanusia_phi.AAC.1